MSPSSTSVRFESPWPCLLAAADQRPGDTRSARLLHVSEKSAEQRGCLAASLTFGGLPPATFFTLLLFIYYLFILQVQQPWGCGLLSEFLATIVHSEPGLKARAWLAGGAGPGAPSCVPACCRAPS